MRSLNCSRSRSSRKLLGFAAVALLAANSALAQDTGTANFNRYVAVGDSLTAGFISGGLVDEVQRVSYPALISRQARGPNARFELPLVSKPGIPPVLQVANLAPLTIAPASGFGAPTNLQLPRPYDNLAVPGAEVHDVINTRTGGLHDLILRGLGTQLEQALFLRPTFATLWIGNNDALAAATSGVVIEDVTLTSLAAFESKYRTIAGALRASGAQLALATIPNVTAIPFVTAVPPVVVNPATNEPVLVNGQVVPLIGPNGPLTPGVDFVLLTATGELRQGKGIPRQLGGSGEPLSDHVVLSGSEVSRISARVAEFNRVIRTVATETGAALVDVNEIFARIATEGLEVAGISFSARFLSGGLFSTDGVHASAFGYAVVANAFIRAINRAYNANIPLVNFSDYIFGPLASLGTSYPVTASIDFTAAAEANLRFALGVPDRSTLEKLLGSGSDGGGNDAGDEGGDAGGDDEGGGNGNGDNGGGNGNNGGGNGDGNGDNGGGDNGGGDNGTPEEPPEPPVDPGERERGF